MIYKNLINVDVDLKNQDEVLNFIGSESEKYEFISDKESIVTALNAREMVIPTAVGNRIAMPHCKNSAVDKPFILFIRLKESINWGDQETDLIFSIVIPEESEGQLHLKTLSTLSKNLVHKENIDKIRQSNKEDIYKYLNTIIKEEE